MSVRQKRRVVVSRHTFGEILENEDLPLSSCKAADGTLKPATPQDIKGYGLDDWIDHVVVGWDEPMKTYFLQYIEEREEEDELVWWLGTDYAQIPSFDALCAAIREIFGNQVDFKFVNRIAR